MEGGSEKARCEGGLHQEWYSEHLSLLPGLSTCGSNRENTSHVSTYVRKYVHTWLSFGTKHACATMHKLQLCNSTTMY